MCQIVHFNWYYIAEQRASPCIWETVQSIQFPTVTSSFRFVRFPVELGRDIKLNLNRHKHFELVNSLIAFGRLSNLYTCWRWSTFRVVGFPIKLGRCVKPKPDTSKFSWLVDSQTKFGKLFDVGIERLVCQVSNWARNRCSSLYSLFHSQKFFATQSQNRCCARLIHLRGTELCWK